MGGRCGEATDRTRSFKVGSALTTSLAVGIAAAIVISTPAAAHALSLEDSMARALERNPEIAAQRERVSSTRQETAIARAPGLPQVRLDANARSVDLKDPDRLRRGNFESEDWGIGASASQVLYASGRIRNAVRGAAANAEDAEWQFAEAEQALLVNVTRAYTDVLRTRAVLDAQRKSVENIREQRAYVEANRRRGFLTDTDLAQADARLALAQADAERAQAEVVVAEEGFVRLVGDRPDALAAPPTLGNLPENLESALELANDKRAVLRAATAGVRAAEANVRSAEAEGRPRVSLEASTEAFGDLGYLNETAGNEDTVALRFSLPIFSGGLASARAQQQRFERNAARYDLEAVRREVRQDVVSAWSRLEASRAALRAAENQVSASELAVRGVRREQQNGLRSVIDVLDQERDLLAARVELARAQRDLTVAEREMLFAVGGLTAQSGGGAGPALAAAEAAPETLAAVEPAAEDIARAEEDAAIVAWLAGEDVVLQDIEPGSISVAADEIGAATVQLAAIAAPVDAIAPVRQGSPLTEPDALAILAATPGLIEIFLLETEPTPRPMS